MQPLVSILIPAYNAQQWISETLRSAVLQTWERKEIIVVNDGSIDQTDSLARQFESKIVRVVNQTNQGAAAARNRAFAESQGNYIQWLDADDLLSPDKISLQMAAAQRCDSDRTLISGAWGNFLHRHRRASFVPTALWCDLLPAEWMIRQMEENVYMQTATWLVSRKLTETAGPWDTRLLGDDDGEYFCRVLMASNGVRFVPEAKVYYRATGSTSLSYIGHCERKREAQWISMKLHLEYVLSVEDSPRSRAACIRYLENWLIYFYPERLDLVEEAQQWARKLGGELRLPHLSWKYSWIAATFGWKAAKQAQLLLPGLRWAIQKSVDQALLRLERGAIRRARS